MIAAAAVGVGVAAPLLPGVGVESPPKARGSAVPASRSSTSEGGKEGTGGGFCRVNLRKKRDVREDVLLVVRAAVEKFESWLLKRDSSSGRKVVVDGVERKAAVEEEGGLREREKKFREEEEEVVGREGVLEEEAARTIRAFLRGSAPAPGVAKLFMIDVEGAKAAILAEGIARRDGSDGKKVWSDNPTAKSILSRRDQRFCPRRKGRVKGIQWYHEQAEQTMVMDGKEAAKEIGLRTWFERGMQGQANHAEIFTNRTK